MKNSKLKIPLNYIDKIICISDILVEFSNGRIVHFRRNRNDFTKKELENIFQSLFHTYSDFDYYWIDNHECAIKLWDSNFFKNIISIFKKSNVEHKLFFVDNNLGESKYKELLNYKQVPGLIGFTKKYNFEIIPRKFDKKFICLNRIPKPHRRNIFTYMRDNFESHSFLSFAPINSQDKDFKYLDDVPETTYGNMSHAWPSDFQKKSFVNIVTESMYDSGPIHITEKTDKCFSAGQPFLLVSGPYYLKKLKELGFKTFDKWWDESYDLEWDGNLRINLIKDTIKKISFWSIEECEKKYEEMIPILKHNQNHAKSFKRVGNYDMVQFESSLWELEKIEFNENKSLF